MDPSAEARDIAKKQYTNVRRSLTEFEERYLASRWDEDAIVRQGFDRFLGSLDRVAGWLFPEPDRPRQALEKGTEPDTREQIQHEAEGADTTEQAHADDQPVTVEPQPEPEPEPATATATGTDTWEQATAEEPDLAKPTEPHPAEPAPIGTVDVTFTLPADIEAVSVALCGEFNGWSEDDILLSRDADGPWRTTVPLVPGRYRYRFLIDGTRWENARYADDYVPNPFGELDSVVIVVSS